MYFFKEALVTRMSMLNGSISQQLLDKNSDLRKAIDSMLHDVTLFDPEFVLKVGGFLLIILFLRGNFISLHARLG